MINEGFSHFLSHFQHGLFAVIFLRNFYFFLTRRQETKYTVFQVNRVAKVWCCHFGLYGDIALLH